MASGTVQGTVPFHRRKLRDGTVLPLEERQRIAYERELKLTTRVNARKNMEHFRSSSLKSWPDEDFTTVVAMLGLDDQDVEERAAVGLPAGEHGPVEEGPG